MSIVIAVATTDKIIIKSDGREIDSQTKQVVDEHSTKMKQICDNAIIGYTGDKQACDAFVSAVMNYVTQPIYEPKYIITIIEQLMQICKQFNTKLNIILGIIYNKNSSIYTWSYMDGYKIHKDNAIKDGVVYSISYCDDNNLNFEDYYNRLINVETCMDRYIVAVSKIDSSVNRNIETKILSVN